MQTSPDPAFQPDFQVVSASAEKVVLMAPAEIVAAWKKRGALNALFLAIGNAANGRGLKASLGDAFRLVDSKSSFFPGTENNAVLAEAAPLFPAGAPQAFAAWRTRIYFTAGSLDPDAAGCAAEVTDTAVREQGPNSVNVHAATTAVVADEVAFTGSDDEREGGRKRTQTSEQRIKQILKGGFKVISKKGYGNASIREIAAAAGLPIPTMYLYIKTKEDLLYLMSKEYLGKLKDEFEGSLSTSAPASDVLRQAVYKYIEYCKVNRKLINLVYQEGKWLSPENRKKIFEVDRSFVTIWEKIIERGVQSGEFAVKDAALAADHIYFLCTSRAIRNWTLERFDDELVRDSLCDFVMRALSGDAKATASAKPRAS